MNVPFPLCMADFILCYELMLYDVTSLVTGEKESPSIVDSNHQDGRLKLYYITLCLQVGSSFSAWVSSYGVCCKLYL